MAVQNGQPVNQLINNSSNMSRLQDTSTVGRVDVNNVTDSTSPQSGALHTTGGLGVEKSATVGANLIVTQSATVGTNLNVSQNVNVGADLIVTDSADISGTLNATGPAYLSDVEADSLAVEQGITAFSIATSTANLTTITAGGITTTGLTANGAAQFNNNVTIEGNLTVNGTQTTLNTASLDVEDKNIVVNKSGDDSTSEGAGLTIDRTGTKGSLIYKDASSSKFAIGALGSEADVVTTTGTQTLTNKTLTSPSITNPSLTRPVTNLLVGTDQVITPAAPASGQRLLYAKSDGWYQQDYLGAETKVGSGSGGGAKNFIVDGDAESANAFLEYNDGTAYPVDGIGGTTTGVSSSKTSTNPLTGTFSYLLTKTGNALGQGWYIDFTTDLASQAKVLQISFDYLINSGSFVAGTSSTSSDVRVFIYDKINARIIEPSSTNLFSNSLTFVDKFSSTFQTPHNSTSFRLIFHCANANTNNFSLKVDSISVSPSVYVYGSPITDWQNKGVIPLGAVTTAPTKGTILVDSYRLRRVGDSYEYDFQYSHSAAGVAGSGDYLINLPHAIDLTKTPVNSILGKVHMVAVPSVNFSYQGSFSVYSATQLRVIITYIASNGTVGAFSTWSSGNASLANANVSFYGSVTLASAGLSSSVQMSSDAALSPVISTAFKSTAQSIPSAVHTHISGYDAPAINRGGYFNPTTGYFTVTKAGDYKVFATLAWVNNATGYRLVSITKNGSPYQYGNSLQAVTSGDGTGVVAYAIIPCVAGDIIGMSGFQNTGGNLDVRALSNATSLSVELYQGSQTLAASETVAARYTTSTGQSIPHSTMTVVNFNVKDFDSHNAVTTGASWKFTAPISGTYLVSGLTLYQSATWGAGSLRMANLYKNGTINAGVLFHERGQATTSTFLGATVSASTLIKLNAGDYIDYRIIHEQGGAVSLQPDGTLNHISIHRVGN